MNTHLGRDASGQSRDASQSGGGDVGVSRRLQLKKSLAGGGFQAAEAALQCRGGSAPNASTAQEGFKGGGGTLPHQSQVESGIGADLSGVRAHTGPEAQAACQSMGAEAYTFGNDIAFSTASPTPELVAHEATHAVHQGAAKSTEPRLSVGGGASSAAMEAEADSAASGLRSASSAGPAAQSAPAQRSVQLKPKKKKTTVMQDIALGQDPNERERAILENDSEAASAWVEAASWAVGIAVSYSYTQKSPEKSMYGGRADALRHFLWNAYMAYILGEERAAALANAHELSEKPADKNMAVDREMDFRNNRAGRQLGVVHRSQGTLAKMFTLPLMAAAGISFVNDGSLTVLDKRDNNNWKLVPSNTAGVD